MTIMVMVKVVMPWQWPLFPCFGPSRPITKSYTIQHLPYLWYGQVFFHVQVHWDFSSSYEHFKCNFSSTSIRRIGLRSVPSPTWMLKFFFWLHLCSQITFIGLDGLLLWSLCPLSSLLFFRELAQHTALNKNECFVAKAKSSSLSIST